MIPLELKQFAITVIKQAGALTLPYFRNREAISVSNKAEGLGFDPVTLADKSCEQYIRSKIAETYPDHAICGEEYHQNGSSDWEWVIDPIDGTRAFLSGFLHWGVLLGLKVKQKPVLGFLYQPFTRELFVGDNQSAQWIFEGRTLQMGTSSCDSLQEATLTTTDPRLFLDSQEQSKYKRVEQQARLVRYGNDCYQYAMLAHGQVDVVLEVNLNPWDIQPLVPIVKGAGGSVVNWEGGEDLSAGQVVAAANPSILDQVLKYLNN